MSKIPCASAHASLDEIDRLLAALDEPDGGADVFETTPQPEKSWLTRFRESGLSIHEFNDLERKNVANSNVPLNAQAESSQRPKRKSIFVCPVAVVTDFSPSSTGTGNTPRTSARPQHSINQNRKPWVSADEDEIFKASCQIAHNGNGVAWSLNLSPKKIEHLTKTAANGNDPTRVLTKDLHRQLKRLLGNVPPYNLALEFDDNDRLHAHGSVAGLQDTSPEFLRLLRRALAVAGGKIVGVSGRGQVHTKFLHDGFGWGGYTLKTLRRTRKRLGTEKVVFISRPLKQMTRAAWNAALAPKKPPSSKTIPTTTTTQAAESAPVTALISKMRTLTHKGGLQRVSVVAGVTRQVGLDANQRASLSISLVAQIFRPAPRGTSPPRLRDDLSPVVKE